MAETTEKKTEKRQERATGVVVTSGGFRTCSVAINNMVRHPLYGKYIKRRTKLAVHDPMNEAAVGDTVEVSPCRPISKTKRWRLIRIVKKATLPQSGSKA
jgi:small subunit ribosomal protein S17